MMKIRSLLIVFMVMGLVAGAGCSKSKTPAAATGTGFETAEDAVHAFCTVRLNYEDYWQKLSPATKQKLADTSIGKSFQDPKLFAEFMTSNDKWKADKCRINGFGVKDKDENTVVFTVATGGAFEKETTTEAQKIDGLWYYSGQSISIPLSALLSE